MTYPIDIKGAEFAALVEAAHCGDERAMEHVLAAFECGYNQKILQDNGRSLMYYGYSVDEIIQEMRIGVAAGVRNYDASKTDNPSGFLYKCAQRKVISLWNNRNAKKNKVLNEAASLDELQTSCEDGNLHGVLHDDMPDPCEILSRKEETPVAYYDSIKHLIAGMPMTPAQKDMMDVVTKCEAHTVTQICQLYQREHPHLKYKSCESLYLRLYTSIRAWLAADDAGKAAIVVAFNAPYIRPKMASPEIAKRNAAIYHDRISGISYHDIASKYDMTFHATRQACYEFRKKHNLPRIRKCNKVKTSKPSYKLSLKARIARDAAAVRRAAREEKYRRMYEQYISGTSMQDIADKHGMSRQMVWLHIRPYMCERANTATPA